MKPRKPIECVAMYLRVSSAQTKNPEDARQNPDIQEQAIRALVQSRGWRIFAVYKDWASGADPHRPDWKLLMQVAHQGQFQAVVVWSLDRWARDLADLIQTVKTLEGYGVGFVSLKEPSIDTTTSAGMLMLQILGAFAQFERERLRERTIEGVDYAKANGTRSGNPIGRPKRIFRVDEALKLKQQGWSWRRLALHFGVGEGTVRRRCAETVAP